MMLITTLHVESFTSACNLGGGVAVRALRAASGAIAVLYALLCHASSCSCMLLLLLFDTGAFDSALETAC